MFNNNTNGQFSAYYKRKIEQQENMEEKNEIDLKRITKDIKIQYLFI